MNNLKPRKRVPNVCYRCNSRDVAVRHRSDVLDYKGLTLEVDGLANTVCNSCHLEWMTDGQERDNLEILRSAFAEKRDAVRTSEGLLTGEQISNALQLLNLSRADAAKLFGGGPNAFGKYISGDVLQSFAMDRLVRMTLAFGRPAVRYLSLGKNAPLALNAAGYYVSPPAGNATFVRVTAREETGPLRLLEAQSTSLESSSR